MTHFFNSVVSFRVNPGAIYHVMNRGERREGLFEDDQDRQRFLQTLAEACAKTDWQVHADCLMKTHFHLVVETPRANLVPGMKWLLSAYAIRFTMANRLRRWMSNCGIVQIRNQMFNGYV